MRSSIIHRDPDILNGEPVFRGTRVPVQVLFDYLQYSTIDEFLIGYPHIDRAMVNEVLTVAANQLTRRRARHERTA
ncbi:DUF433 domain-containing protein [Spirosoma montaniterrae]|uniref:DUF433 domain-containing protein n=1 Tax=Spirosoma montaniterrae TaxID=1178516 RepID=A0A1P9WYZ3_9BACT|nr:DUF433 domain-containing protein [Spirosoma montaniterrae]AQG80589.1 hypothetical protein AWR27_15430 [Spirosoma montaniterrae]